MVPIVQQLDPKIWWSPSRYNKSEIYRHDFEVFNLIYSSGLQNKDILTKMLILGHFRGSLKKQHKNSIVRVCCKLRGHNWMHFAIGHLVLLHWIQTLLSEKPEMVFN